MKAAKNTSCATVVQQITSEDATVTHAFHVLKGWNDVYYLSSKAPRPAPREHHEQRQVNLPRQVQVRGQGLIFRCGKEEDPAMLSDYAMPIHIQRHFKGSPLLAVCLAQPTPLLAGSLMSHQSTAKTCTSRPPFFEAAFGDTA